MNFRFRSLVHSRHFVVVEIRLLDSATADGDGVMQSSREAINGRAFDLRADTLRIDRPAAIYRVNDAMHFHAAVFNAGFHHRRSVALKGIVSGDSV